MPKKRYFKFVSASFDKLYDDFQLNVNSTDIEEKIESRKFEGFSF